MFLLELFYTVLSLECPIENLCTVQEMSEERENIELLLTLVSVGSRTKHTSGTCQTSDQKPVLLLHAGELSRHLLLL